MQMRYNILIYFSSIVKQAIFAYVNYARIRSWDQAVWSNEGKVSCSWKLREAFMRLELTTDRHTTIRVRSVSHCATKARFPKYVKDGLHIMCVWKYSFIEKTKCMKTIMIRQWKLVMLVENYTNIRYDNKNIIVIYCTF